MLGSASNGNDSNAPIVATDAVEAAYQSPDGDGDAEKGSQLPEDVVVGC